MAGTKQGGLKAAATNKERHGKDFYKNIGRQGGGVPVILADSTEIPRGPKRQERLVEESGREVEN